MTRALAQDCNLVLYTGAGTAANNAIYSSGTYNQGNPAPCRMLVSSTGAGSIMVLDSANHILFMRPAPPQGTLVAGQILAQVLHICTSALWSSTKKDVILCDLRICYVLVRRTCWVLWSGR